MNELVTEIACRRVLIFARTENEKPQFKKRRTVKNCQSPTCGGNLIVD